MKTEEQILADIQRGYNMARVESALEEIHAIDVPLIQMAVALLEAWYEEQA